MTGRWTRTLLAALTIGLVCGVANHGLRAQNSPASLPNRWRWTPAQWSTEGLPPRQPTLAAGPGNMEAPICSITFMSPTTAAAPRRLVHRTSPRPAAGGAHLLYLPAADAPRNAVSPLSDLSAMVRRRPRCDPNQGRLVLQPAHGDGQVRSPGDSPGPVGRSPLADRPQLESRSEFPTFSRNPPMKTLSQAALLAGIIVFLTVMASNASCQDGLQRVDAQRGQLQAVPESSGDDTAATSDAAQSCSNGCDHQGACSCGPQAIYGRPRGFIGRSQGCAAAGGGQGCLAHLGTGISQLGTGTATSH